MDFQLYHKELNGNREIISDGLLLQCSICIWNKIEVDNDGIPKSAHCKWTIIDYSIS